MKSLQSISKEIHQDFPDLVEYSNDTAIFTDISTVVPDSISSQLLQRVAAIQAQLIDSLQAYANESEEAVKLICKWMLEEKVVRIIGAGRARLAAAIPANRISHAGARVHVQDDIIPMPHSIRGGGMIAVSASGQTETVLAVLEATRKHSRDVEVLGIASSAATEFASYCDVFIGIESPRDDLPNPLRALADTEEYVISELLDGLVVSAGKSAGFDDAYWRLGHENLGATGPYDYGQNEGKS